MASCGALLWRTVAAFPSVSREVNLHAHPNTQLKCCVIEREIRAESSYLLCILIHFPWLQQEPNNNNNNKSTEQWAKNLFELKNSPGFFSEAVLHVLLYLSHVFFVSLFFASSLFSASLFLQQFLLQIRNISSRTRRDEAVLLLLGACAPSLGCRGETAMVATLPYVREIRATRVFWQLYWNRWLWSEIPPAAGF